MSAIYTRKTKIVCTMGPACDTDETVRDVILNGMNVARFNFSHGTYADQKERMDRVKRVSARLGIPVAVMLDTKGPEIRTGMTSDGGIIEFEKGCEVAVTADDALTAPPRGTQPGTLSLNWKDAVKRIKTGVRILIADGLFELDVLENDGTRLLCRAANSAKIGSKKNVNLIGLHAGLPVIAEQDKADLRFGAGEDIDFVAASFLSFPREVTEIRTFLQKIQSTAKIIAKIENEEGLANIEEITALADGIMVARGDLAVQIPDEQIPLAQKKITAVARRHCKPVIIATQMLDSMIVNPRPTRAELTDVANAIFDGADAVMLSGETAQGAYPAESVATLAKIAATVEQSPEFRKWVRLSVEQPSSEVKTALKIGTTASHATEVAEAVSRSAYETALAVHAKVILTPTSSGNTARQISRFRPEQTIVAVTPNERVHRSLLLNWGVEPKITALVSNSDDMIQNALKICSESGLATISDRLILAAGLPIGGPQPLNTVRVLIMGNILARSASGGFSNAEIIRVCGRIVWADSALQAREIIKQAGGEILVCPALTEEYIPILRIVRGVICEGVCALNASMLSLINPNLVWLAGVQGASRKLESGISVTLDGKALLVYEGTV